jgi:hypothetical protein
LSNGATAYIDKETGDRGTMVFNKNTAIDNSHIFQKRIRKDTATKSKGDQNVEDRYDTESVQLTQEETVNVLNTLLARARLGGEDITDWQARVLTPKALDALLPDAKIFKGAIYLEGQDKKEAVKSANELYERMAEMMKSELGSKEPATEKQLNEAYKVSERENAGLKEKIATQEEESRLKIAELQAQPNDRDVKAKSKHIETSGRAAESDKRVNELNTENQELQRILEAVQQTLSKAGFGNKGSAIEKALQLLNEKGR